MEIQKGTIFTPDKKKLLIDEVQTELNKLNDTIRLKKGITGTAAQTLTDISEKLKNFLNILFNKKGVVTPQETDEILSLIDDSKRSRLQSDYYFGMKRATFYLILIGALSVGAYFYTKKVN